MPRLKVIVVTGGVLSGLGKGIVSASIGRLLSPQYKVVPIKCDGYLNIDPGTMNPVEHGEVFVLDDGGEVDLDFGHYERFINQDCKFHWNLTSGKIFQSLVEKERRGDFLGKTVQVIPHVTGEIREQFKNIAKQEKADILLIEVGGTVGDLENLWFLEAVRELEREFGRENIVLVHLGLVPVIDEQGQQKTKPIQQSSIFLRDRGLFPSIIVGRSTKPLSAETKQKIHWLLNIPKHNVVSDPDLESVYELPLIFEKEKFAEVLSKELNIKVKPKLTNWKKLVHNIKNPKHQIYIAICGKYTELADSYLSILEALVHAGAHYQVQVGVKWIETTELDDAEKIKALMHNVHGVIVPGGFGSRGTEGKIRVIQFARENKVPFLGICYGMQLAVIEFARNVCQLYDANSTEIVESTPYPVVDLLPEQRNVYQKGGTMRLGGHIVALKKGTKAAAMFKKPAIKRRFRHRWEINPHFIQRLEEKGLIFSGKAKDQDIMQLMELPNHPFFMAAQFHPELTSRLERPSELFLGLVKESALFSKRNPDE